MVYANEIAAAKAKAIEAGHDGKYLIKYYQNPYCKV
jgi:hypothetical protein